MVTEPVARSFWRKETSGLEAWDLVTPNRASSNIGEFAMLLPGEEQVVLTKEMFVIRVLAGQEQGWDAFYLLWALCLDSVRKQWQRVTLMQTNREDVGGRYREILLPKPKSKDWAKDVSEPFRSYFMNLAESQTKFKDALSLSTYNYIASARSVGVVVPDASEDDATAVADDVPQDEQ